MGSEMNKITFLIMTFCAVFIKCDLFVPGGCIKCNSSSDANCVGLRNQILSQDCKNSSSTCYVRVKDGYTIRGCTEELTPAEAEECKNDLNDDFCRLCNDRGCNGDVKFPGHRLSCLICSGDLNSTCSTNIDLDPTICQVYNKDDKCVIYKSNEKNKVTRGCLSTKEVKDVCPSEKICFMCDTHGCNNKAGNSSEIPNSGTTLFLYTNILLVVSFMIALSK